jgi:hypothetical protein
MSLKKKLYGLGLGLYFTASVAFGGYVGYKSYYNLTDLREKSSILEKLSLSERIYISTTVGVLAFFPLFLLGCIIDSEVGSSPGNSRRTSGSDDSSTRTSGEYPSMTMLR